MFKKCWIVVGHFSPTISYDKNDVWSNSGRVRWADWSGYDGETASFKETRLHLAEVGDGVFDIGNRVGALVAFDRNPAAVIEFGEEAEDLWEVGGTSA